MFVRKAGAYPSGATKEAPLTSRLMALYTNIRLGWKGLPGTKQSSLLRKSVNYGRKSFVTLVPGEASVWRIRFSRQSGVRAQDVSARRERLRLRRLHQDLHRRTRRSGQEQADGVGR